jgi:hypothetical protein
MEKLRDKDETFKAPEFLEAPYLTEKYIQENGCIQFQISG